MWLIAHKLNKCNCPIGSIISCCSKSENITDVITDAVKIWFILAPLRCCYMSAPKVNRSWKDFETRPVSLSQEG